MISSALIFNSDMFSDYIVYNDEKHTEYLVQIDKEDKTVKCDCPDFKFRKETERFGGAKLEDKQHHCKHIKEVLNGSH